MSGVMLWLWWLFVAEERNATRRDQLQLRGFIRQFQWGPGLSCFWHSQQRWLVEFPAAVSRIRMAPKPVSRRARTRGAAAAPDALVPPASPSAKNGDGSAERGGRGGDVESHHEMTVSASSPSMRGRGPDRGGRTVPGMFSKSGNRGKTRTEIDLSTSPVIPNKPKSSNKVTATTELGETAQQNGLRVCSSEPPPSTQTKTGSSSLPEGFKGTEKQYVTDTGAGRMLRADDRGVPPQNEALVPENTNSQEEYLRHWEIVTSLILHR